MESVDATLKENAAKLSWIKFLTNTSKIQRTIQKDCERCPPKKFRMAS
jgi:hypothetical protein